MKNISEFSFQNLASFLFKLRNILLSSPRLSTGENSISYNLINICFLCRFFRFARAHHSGYCRFKNPYHNNLHAADVAQTVHHVLCQTGLMHWLTDLEIFATLVAALIHDYEHTGTTNNFHGKRSDSNCCL